MRVHMIQDTKNEMITHTQHIGYKYANTKARLEQGWKLSGFPIFSHTQSVA